MLANVNLQQELEQELGMDRSESSGNSSSSSNERVAFIARVAASHCGMQLSPPQVHSTPHLPSLGRIRYSLCCNSNIHISLTLRNINIYNPHTTISPFRRIYFQVFCRTSSLHATRANAFPPLCVSISNRFCCSSHWAIRHAFTASCINIAVSDRCV
jgi:hypothetical protein